MVQSPKKPKTHHKGKRLSPKKLSPAKIAAHRRSASPEDARVDIGSLGFNTSGSAPIKTTAAPISQATNSLPIKVKKPPVASSLSHSECLAKFHVAGTAAKLPPAASGSKFTAPGSRSAATYNPTSSPSSPKVSTASKIYSPFQKARQPGTFVDPNKSYPQTLSSPTSSSFKRAREEADEDATLVHEGQKRQRVLEKLTEKAGRLKDEGLNRMLIDAKSMKGSKQRDARTSLL